MNVFIDIETIPDQSANALEEIRETIRPPANYKKPETIQKWQDEHGEAAALEAYHRTSLDGLRGEICSIAYAVDDGPIYSTTVKRRPHGLCHAAIVKHVYALRSGLPTAAPADEQWPDENKSSIEGSYPLTAPRFVAGEAELLEDFFAHISDLADSRKGLTWVGHNVIDFDLRYLKQRSILRGVKPSRMIPADARHGASVYDTMKAWAGWRGMISQDALCKAMGIAHPDDKGIDGSQVWQLMQDKRYDVVAEYNRLDVWKVREMFRRMEFTAE